MKARPMPETPGAPARRDARSLPTRSRDSGASGRDAPLYGALDLGTNNCRLLIARPARDGFRVVDSFSRIVRLGALMIALWTGPMTPLPCAPSA